MVWQRATLEQERLTPSEAERNGKFSLVWTEGGKKLLWPEFFMFLCGRARVLINGTHSLGAIGSVAQRFGFPQLVLKRDLYAVQPPPDGIRNRDSFSLLL